MAIIVNNALWNLLEFFANYHINVFRIKGTAYGVTVALL